MEELLLKSAKEEMGFSRTKRGGEAEIPKFMTQRSRPKSGATPAPGRLANDRPPEPASNPPHFFTFNNNDITETMSNSATFRDLDFQDRQSDLSQHAKEMWTKPLAEPGYQTTNPMDDLIP